MEIAFLTLKNQLNDMDRCLPQEILINIAIKLNSIKNL